MKLETSLRPSDFFRISSFGLRLFPILALLLSLAHAAFAEDLSLDSAPPVVVKTLPVAGAANVDPALAEIRVTFSKPMTDHSWSWCTWSEESYPTTTGSPRYLEDGRTCILPVKLEPGKFYATWLNSDKFTNFKDAAGRAAVPYLLTFTTAAVSQPPADVIAEALGTISQCAESDPRVAESMARLHALPAEQAVAGLAPYLESPKDTLRRSAIFALWNGKFPSITPAVAGLQKALTHEEDLTRGMAALALGKNRVAGSFDALAVMTAKDSSGYARRCAAIALGWLGDPRAEAVLKAALNDSEKMVQQNAQHALDLLAQKPADGSAAAAASPIIAQIQITADKAVVEGQGSTEGRIVFNIGASQWSCGFVKNIGFTATLSPKGTEPLFCAVYDAEGTRLLTLPCRSGTTHDLTKGRIVFRTDAVLSVPTNRAHVADFHPPSGEPMPITVRVEATGPKSRADRNSSASGAGGGDPAAATTEPTTSPENQEGFILDNAWANLQGSWAKAGSSRDKYGEDYMFCGTTDAAGNTATCQYRLKTIPAGTYDVDIWYPQGPKRATNAPWVVCGPDGSMTNFVNQRQNGGQWVRIASQVRLSPDTSHVTLQNNTGATGDGTVVVADAIRVTPSATDGSPAPATQTAPQPHNTPRDAVENLNPDQHKVVAWTDRQFRSYYDQRTFEGWSHQEKADLEKRLLDTLQGPQTREYYQAINTLGALGGTNALTALRAIAFDRQDKNNRDRWMAVRALGLLRDRASVPDLIHLVYHGNVNTRWWAQITLVRLTGQNFDGDWKAWGRWWNEHEKGQPPYSPEIIRWWKDQPTDDQLAESLAESDKKFLEKLP